jgi:hypothetical protein
MLEDDFIWVNVKHPQSVGGEGGTKQPHAMEMKEMDRL